MGLFRNAYNCLMFPEVYGTYYPDAEATMDGAKLEIDEK